MRVIRVGTRKSQVSMDLVHCLKSSNTHKVTSGDPEFLAWSKYKCVGVNFMGNGSSVPLKRVPGAGKRFPEKGLAGQARSFLSPREKSNPFHIFLDP